jgi:hypothetical protein
MSEPVHPNIISIMGEDYRSVILEKGVPLQVQLPDGRIVRPAAVTYGPERLVSKGAQEGPVLPTEPSPLQVQQNANPSDAAIMENLRRLNDAANAYYDANGTTSVTLENLVGPGNMIPELVPVAGENYRSVLFKKGHPLRLFLKDGRTLVYPPQNPVHP